MGTAFYKMTGSGNDFVMLDGRATDPTEWSDRRIAAVCDRRAGVGADGIVILSPNGAGTVRMLYFNADGSRAALCGNAALCSTRLAATLGLAPAHEMLLVTDAGPLRARCLEGPDLAEINVGDVAPPEPTPGVELEPGEMTCQRLLAGVPHLVVMVRDAAAVDVLARGRRLRFHPDAGAEGANTNFLSAPARPGEPWRMRTYERGVEDETYACGTGAVAAAVALAASGHASLPLQIMTRGGGVLTVRAHLANGGASDVWLAGPGALVFRGELPL